jgi:hypothetical protein
MGIIALRDCAAFIPSKLDGNEDPQLPVVPAHPTATA